MWQVKSGTIFNNLLITDSVEEAKAHAAETFEPLKEAEKKLKEEWEEEEKKKAEEERKKAEEAAKEEKKDDEEKEEEAEEKDHDEL